VSRLRRAWSRARRLLPRRRAAVVDACLFFNELDLFELRLRELWDVVDRFVVVEASFSHAGARKPLLFAEHAERFAPWREKIVHRALAQAPLERPRDERERAVLERFQRDAIGAAVEPLGLRGGDVVVVSDVDEIPRASAVPSLAERVDAARFAVFVQRHHHRYVNHAWPGGTPPAWCGSVACRWREMRRVGAHRVRRGGDRAGVLFAREDPRWSYVRDGGWHLTWMGGAEAAWTKAQNVFDSLDRASGLRDVGPPQPIRAFPSAVTRAECREIQAHYLAHADPVPAFTPLDFDAFEIEQDVPAALLRDRDRYRRWFFFTSGV
jgi:hypothetical protein